MPLPIPIVERAIWGLLTSPVGFVAAAMPTDANRNEVAADLAAMGCGVFVGSIPQDATEQLNVVVSRVGGLPATGVSPIAASQTVVDVDIYIRQSQRQLLEQSQLLTERIRVLLSQFSGTVEGVEIIDIGEEAEPFSRPSPPRDGSDEWYIRITTPYLITFKQAVASMAGG